jgi:uncharacterized protein
MSRVFPARVDRCHRHDGLDAITVHELLMNSPANKGHTVSEEEMIAFLSDPTTYPHRPETARVIQTHISYVALVPPYVYKVKKAVNLGFLDFSSLARRRHFCEEEVRLNRRMCRDVYEAVVPISRTEHGLALECDKDVVEFAVRMKLLEDGCFLHQLVARDPASTEHLDRVSERLAGYYCGQSSSPALAEWGKIEKLQISTSENFEQIEPFVGTLLTAPALTVIRHYTNQFFYAQELLLNRRRAEGHILDGHGDLRLEHIHVTEEAVSIFDCVEFSERLRCVDTASDVAFLAMDLDYQDRQDLASRFVQHISKELSDPDLHKLLDFYKCYRACVRGKVEGMRSQESQVNAQERQASRDQAVRYFQLALNYATAGSDPMVLVIMGRIGSGKSAVAELLSQALGWSVESSDRTRKRLAEPAKLRGALYSKRMTGITYDKLLHIARDRARSGNSTILDATFGEKIRRDQLRSALRSDGVAYCFMELTAPESLLKHRLEKRVDATAHGSDARRQDFDGINARYEQPDALEDAFHRQVDAAGPIEATVHEILMHLAAYRRRGSNACQLQADSTALIPED